MQERYATKLGVVGRPPVIPRHQRQPLAVREALSGGAEQGR